MNYNVTAIPGDGIGPEIVREARKVLDQVGRVYGHSFHYTEVLMGGCSIDAHGVPLTDEALETARNSDAVLLPGNPQPENVPLYEHFGFKVFGVVEKHFDLKQYCLVREVQ